MNEFQNLAVACQNFKGSVARFGDRVREDRQAEIIRLTHIRDDVTRSGFQRAFARKLVNRLTADALK